MGKLHPLSVRRATLRLISDGTSFSKASRRHGVYSSSVIDWSKASGIAKNSKLTDEELDQKIEAWGETYRNMALPDDATPKQRSIKNLKDRKKFGNPIEDRITALSMLKNMGDPDVYLEAISEQFNQVAAQMDRATSVQDQMTAMWAGWLLVQMRELLETKVTLGSISDVEKLFGMFRKTFHMDANKSGGNEGPDLGLLNAKVGARSVVEVVPARRPRISKKAPKY